MAILEVRGLVKYYGRRKVVDGVSFEVDVGEVVGLLGGNGAGKTTSFRMATGQVTPNDGKVQFTGRDVSQLPMFKRARLGMGYLPQETSVFRKLTVEQNILATLELMPIHRTTGRKLRRAERWDRTDKVLAEFGLSHLRKNNAARLSGGEKRRLEIARCLVCDPLLILLDEPFTGIDPLTIGDIKQIVRDLRNQGIGILVTDHQVREVLTITDRSYLIKSGKVITQGTPAQIATDPIAIREYLGNSLEDRGFGNALPASPPVPAAPAPSPPPAVREVVEQEHFHRLIEKLKTAEFATAAAELLKRGPAALPALLEALERRDVELRRGVFEVVQRMVPGAAFDPFAPEAQRRQQLAQLRERLHRKAG